jgi:hypothetical protein
VADRDEDAEGDGVGGERAGGDVCVRHRDRAGTAVRVCRR